MEAAPDLAEISQTTHAKQGVVSAKLGQSYRQVAPDVSQAIQPDQIEQGIVLYDQQAGRYGSKIFQPGKIRRMNNSRSLGMRKLIRTIS